MQLTYAQKLEFYKKGYVRIPGVVPVVMVDAAVKAINHSFGNGIDPEKMITFQAQSFCPELRQASGDHRSVQPDAGQTAGRVDDWRRQGRPGEPRTDRRPLSPSG